jgi:hypothetical protein
LLVRPPVNVRRAAGDASTELSESGDRVRDMTTGSRFAVFRERPEVQLFAVRPRVHRGLAVSWWLLVLVSGLLPAGFAVLTGSVVAAVGGQRSLRGPLSAVGVVFVGMVPVPPLLTAVSQNLASTRR